MNQEWIDAAWRRVKYVDGLDSVDIEMIIEDVEPLIRAKVAAEIMDFDAGFCFEVKNECATIALGEEKS